MKKKKFKKADDFPFCFSTNFFHFSYEFSIFLRKKMCSTPVVSTKKGTAVFSRKPPFLFWVLFILLSSLFTLLWLPF